ncbi:hypothetical protein AB6A40_011332 [Gnathostoma spinigerum]|uniref:Uncharacterized protein n=1 Tax=Gnathostoma spinigerum TaxID=75299 RepID=A0ABD6EXC9_9BILA
MKVKCGFGWTNGAVLDLMVTYSKRVVVKLTGVTSAPPVAVASLNKPTILVKGTQFDLTNAITQGSIFFLFGKAFREAVSAFIKCKG